MGHGCHDCGSPNSCECPKKAVEPASSALSEHGALMRQWMVRNEHYRLVCFGPSTTVDSIPDRFVLERLGKDATGSPRWDEIDKWDKFQASRRTELVLAMGMMG